jgi:dTDP-4-dehydrorhamnose reductase
VSGYTHAVFSGPTAPVLSRAILTTIQGHPDLEGAWHIAAEPIAKHDLLEAIRAALDLNVEIVPDGSVRIDRSLDASRFATATGWAAPPWQEMVHELGSASANPVGQSVAGR